MRDLSLASAGAAGDSEDEPVAGDEGAGDEGASDEDDDGVATGAGPPQAAMVSTLTTRTTAKRIHRR
jgi:hypothetical protein